MQSSSLGTTVRVGNHALTPEEQAAGAPDRKPFVDAAGNPVDPSTVSLGLLAPDGTRRTFGWPTAATGDTGTLTKESTGRFYRDWASVDGEDGVWCWFLVGSMGTGSKLTDQDVYYVKRPIVPVA